MKWHSRHLKVFKGLIYLSRENNLPKIFLNDIYSGKISFIHQNMTDKNTFVILLFCSNVSCFIFLTFFFFFFFCSILTKSKLNPLAKEFKFTPKTQVSKKT